VGQTMSMANQVRRASAPKQHCVDRKSGPACAILQIIRCSAGFPSPPALGGVWRSS
jgi:hypothetical protein